MDKLEMVHLESKNYYQLKLITQIFYMENQFLNYQVVMDILVLFIQSHFLAFLFHLTILVFVVVTVI
jgi:hypothetical protein